MPTSSDTSGPSLLDADPLDAGPQPATEHETTWPHHALLLLFTFLWGSNFVLAEVALSEMTPIAFSVARFGTAALAMLALHYAQCRTEQATFLPRLDRSDWPRLLLVSVLGATLAPWLGIEGLGLTYAGRAAFWLALAPAASAGLGYLMDTERMNRMGTMGLALAGLGTLGLAIDGLDPDRGYWLGDLLLLTAMLMAVAELHLIRPLASRYGATPIVTLRTVLGGLLYAVIATPALANQPWLQLGGWTWTAILAGGAIGVGFGQWVKVRALRAVGPTQVVIYGNMVPLATLLIAWITIGTASSALEVAAGLLIVAGALLLQIGGASRVGAESSVA